ncbi:hypothetical protein XCR1_2770010 [Xenorhabdus cabanillasii JM26]|uniref:Uncharacterized protein n=1 Tax=Xenorhabdus cabanillasii JM26 TaxID=1427517 RepID=W1J9H9_9GAMM|nr:hypothetical protein XCR1_2770010 [Xenorhabdus cabanillasii JM26]
MMYAMMKNNLSNFLIKVRYKHIAVINDDFIFKKIIRQNIN